MSSASLELSFYSSLTPSVLYLLVDWQHLAKLFSFPQELQFAPKAGQCCCPNRWFPPQNLQVRRAGAFLSGNFQSLCFDFFAPTSSFFLHTCFFPWPFVLLALWTDLSTCMTGLKSSSPRCTSLWICLLVVLVCWMDNTRMFCLSLQWHICQSRNNRIEITLVFLT